MDAAARAGRLKYVRTVPMAARCPMGAGGGARHKAADDAMCAALACPTRAASPTRVGIPRVQRWVAGPMALVFRLLGDGPKGAAAPARWAEREGGQAAAGGRTTAAAGRP